MALHMLPIETYEAVIDQARDDTASLQDLSLVCRAFLPRARYHLFSIVVLQNTQRVEDFSEFIDSHPWVGPLVRKLVHSSFVPISESDPIARMLDVVPLHLLSRLPNLHTWEMGMAGIERRSTEVGAGLSCRQDRTALSSYGSFSHNVRNLELAWVAFEDISDFIELMSTFTGVQRLVCAYISIKSSMESPDSRVRSTQMKNLQISTTVDIRAIQCLLNSSQTTLNHLCLTFQSESLQPDHYFDRLGLAVSSLSCLSSLSFVILSGKEISHDDDTDSRLHNVRSATRIVERVKSTRVQDIRVEFWPDPVARLGSWLSLCPRAMEACKALENALLAFQQPRVLFYNAIHTRRTGRWQFWSSTMRRSFPRLNERGLVTLSDSEPDTLNLAGHETTVMCLVASLHGTSIVSGSDDGTIIIWNAESGTIVHEWLAHLHGVHALVLSPDNQRLISANGVEQTFAVWDVSKSVHKAAAFEDSKVCIRTCVWSPDGAMLASMSTDGTIRILDALTFEQLDQLEGPAGHHFVSGRVWFSPNSRYLVALFGGVSGTITLIWRPLAGGPPTRLKGSNQSGVTDISFDLESRRIATSHRSPLPYENVIRVWDVVTGAALTELVGHRGQMAAISFSPDGRSILSASYDGLAKIWDAGHRRDTTFPPEERSSFGMRPMFSPDGMYVATAPQGGTMVQVWKTDDGSRVARFTPGHKARVRVVFCSDNEHLASGDLDGVVYIHRLSRFIAQ